MTATGAEKDAETAARIERSTLFIRWLWANLGGDDAARKVALQGVLDRMHEIHLDALLDATALAENVLEMRPKSQEAQAIVRNLRATTEMQRQVVQANNEAAS